MPHESSDRNFGEELKGSLPPGSGIPAAKNIASTVVGLLDTTRTNHIPQSPEGPWSLLSVESGNNDVLRKKLSPAFDVTQWKEALSREKVLHVRSILEGEISALSAELDNKAFKSLPPEKKIAQMTRILGKLKITDEYQANAIIAIVYKAMQAATEKREYNMSEIIHISPIEVETMTKLSRKKIAVARLKMRLEKYYDEMSDDEKKDLFEKWVDKKTYVSREIRTIQKNFIGLPSDIVTKLMTRYNFDREVYLFIEAFGNDFGSTQESLEDICMQWDYDVLDILALIDTAPYLGVQKSRIESEIWIQDSVLHQTLTGNYLITGDGVDVWRWIEWVESYEVSQGNFINPNWFLYDLDAGVLQKIWWISKTKQVFGKYFFNRIQNIPGIEEIEPPVFYNFCDFKLPQVWSNISDFSPWKSQSELKLEPCTQHIFEWELPENFSLSELHEIAAHMKSVLPDFVFSGKTKDFNHPIKTTKGRLQYSGYFSGESTFFSTSLLVISQVGKKEQKKNILRFSTDESQDTVLFAFVQISHYLKQKTFLKEKHLWIALYRLYNALSLEGVSQFDPHVFKQQYETIVKQVIWPLSIEYANLHNGPGKARNTLLYGLYGTGKSQLLSHIMSERKFKLPNGKNITLNANVIYISVSEFADLLVKNVSSFRKRLSDIHENTGLPIVLVVEDLDTIIKETNNESDPVSQGLTTFFEWVGSLPVTVLASTNNPEVFPTRHIRPNRLDVLLGFDYPLAPKDLAHIVGIHFEKTGLTTNIGAILSKEEFIQRVLPHVLKFTPSHISKLCSDIARELEFEDIEVLILSRLDEIISQVIENFVISVSDMELRQAGMSQWREKMKTQSSSGWMGFLAK
jgi:hypothetical protein